MGAAAAAAVGWGKQPGEAGMDGAEGSDEVVAMAEGVRASERRQQNPVATPRTTRTLSAGRRNETPHHHPRHLLHPQLLLLHPPHPPHRLPPCSAQTRPGHSQCPLAVAAMDRAGPAAAGWAVRDPLGAEGTWGPGHGVGGAAEEEEVRAQRMRSSMALRTSSLRL